MRRVIIAGSRTVSPTVDEIDAAIVRLPAGDLLWVPSEWDEIICGCARGADRAGETWAKAKGIAVHHEPITKELIDKWGKYLAPKMRNRAMAERADAAIVFWDGTSGGAADMVTRMVVRDKPIAVVPFKAARSRRG